MRSAEQHAHRIAQLYVLRARADRQLARVQHVLDAALVAARRDSTPYADLGDALLVATGKPRTSEGLARVENSLRVATHAALYRRRKPVSGANEAPVAAAHREQQTARMALQLRKRVRVIDYFIDDSVVSASGLGGIDVGDLDLDGLDLGNVERDHDHVRDNCDRTCEVGARVDRKDH